MSRQLSDGYGGGGGGERSDPLSAELVEAISRIEPPAARPDFWERLDEAVGSGPVPRHRAGRRSRYRATLAVVGAAACIAVAVPLALSGRATDSSEELDDPMPVATEPERSVETTTTTLPSPSGELVPGEPAVEDTEAGELPDGGDGQAVPPFETTTTGAPTTSTAPPATLGGPLRLEAENADEAGYGQATEVGWVLWGNDQVRHDVDIPPGGYVVTVMAAGIGDTGLTEPEMELRLNGSAVGSVSVALDEYRLYSFEVTVGAGGLSSLALAFTNDPNREGDNVDLQIDYAEVRPIS